jgi:UDP:flavonoid glycosyltransferase YjiC (YdhE family)
VARIVIAAFGSRGDVVPLTDIGCRVQEAGHEVVLAAPTMFADLISGCGLQFRSFDIELDGSHDLTDANPLKLAMQLVSPKGMRATGEALLTALHDVPADVLLLSPFAELAGHPLAEARDIPSMGVRMQPVSTTAAHPPALLGSWSAGSITNRTAGRLATSMFDAMYGKTIAGFREQLGLPPLSTRALRRRRTEAEWPILHGFSPSVVPRPKDWRSGLEVVGYWWPQRPLGWRPPAKVVSFLESGDAPVFLGFGSLTMTKNESARVSELVRQALRTLGVRGMIQAGWAGLDVADNNVLTVGDIPHDWLFGKVAAVVHSCGAGTMAAGLRTGLPAVAIPEPGGDQPFWARRLRELGVSAATLSRRKLTADRLASAIDAALTDPTRRVNAEQLATRIAEEDGAARAVTALEKLVRA